MHVYNSCCSLIIYNTNRKLVGIWHKLETIVSTIKTNNMHPRLLERDKVYENHNLFLGGGGVAPVPLLSSAIGWAEVMTERNLFAIGVFSLKSCFLDCLLQLLLHRKPDI